MAFTFGFFFRWALHGQIKFVAAIALAQEPNKKKNRASNIHEKCVKVRRAADRKKDHQKWAK